MGLTTLLTNSQDRDFGPYPSINTVMKIPEKLRKNFPPKIKYIEKIPDISVDVHLMCSELKTLNTASWQKTNNQTKLCLYELNWRDFTVSIPYTKTVIDSLKSYMPFNSVYYRYLHSQTCYSWHIDVMETSLHIPLITNEGCKFVYSDAIFSMPADGSVYMVNNSIPHSFMNAGRHDRLHITMDIF